MSAAFGEFSGHTVTRYMHENKAWAVWILCDCDDDILWPLAELVGDARWPALQQRLSMGFMRPDTAKAWDYANEFVLDGFPALVINNIPAGENLEKYGTDVDGYHTQTPRLF